MAASMKDVLKELAQDIQAAPVPYTEDEARASEMSHDAWLSSWGNYFSHIRDSFSRFAEKVEKEV